MEIRSIQSPTLSSFPPPFPIRRDLIETRFVNNARVLRFSKSPCQTLTLDYSKLRSFTVRSQGSGGTGTVSDAERDEQDDNVVFVAGATGRVGSRTVRELLKLGFSVRAGVRNAQKAKALVESVKKIPDAGSTVQPVERLEVVECDLEKPETIGAALGKAAVVICCIGASEKEVFDVTGPYRIDYLATRNLVNSAAVAKVKHFIMVSSLGTNKIGFPAAILNLFWGVLLWKRKAEEALIASGIPYTIVRPGGMERPTDAYKETHNITLSEEDTLFGGQVSNLQVAELMAFMAKNRRLSQCKVVEVIAETSAPLCPIEELLIKIPFQRIPPMELEATIGTSPANELQSAAEVTTLDTLSKPRSEIIESEPVVASATISRPLSPFTAYEDLKPHTSPSLSPLPSAAAAVKAKSDSKTLMPEAPIVPVDEELSRIDTLLPESELAISPSFPDSSTTDVETVEGITIGGQTSISRPLSPFTAYEGLKPPSSPTPVPSGSSNKPESALLPMQNLTDMSVIDSTPEQASPPLAYGSNIAGQDTGEQEASQVSTQYLSPYYAYEDFKPPTSPSPSPRTSSIAHSSLPLNGGLSLNVIPPPTADAPGPAQLAEQVSLTKPKPRPLSPFTMYEDLKPPNTRASSSGK